MTKVLKRAMSSQEKQDLILEVSSSSEKKKLEELERLRVKRRRIRQQLGKDVMKLALSPIELQKKWRSE